MNRRSFVRGLLGVIGLGTTPALVRAATGTNQPVKFDWKKEAENHYTLNAGPLRADMFTFDLNAIGYYQHDVAIGRRPLRWAIRLNAGGPSLDTFDGDTKDAIEETELRMRSAIEQVRRTKPLYRYIDHAQ